VNVGASKMNNKLLIVFFVGLLLVGSVSAANYYVSTSSSGTGSGDSWANKKDFRTLNTASLQPGDVVYIDGGTNGLTYIASPFTIYSRGTPDKYIKFTRGLEAGHNGMPIFKTNSEYVGASILLEGAQYAEISHIKIMSIGKAARAIDLTKRSNTDIWSHHVDILYNEIEHINGTGIQLNGADDTRIMYNRIYTGVIDTTRVSDAIWSGMITKNLEVAHNYFLLQNRATGSTAHKDFMQLNGLTGTTKIHDNFFRATTSDYQAIYGGTSSGNILIYNNIIDFTGTDMLRGVGGSMINLVNDSTKYLSVEVYNNIFIGTGYNNIGFYNLDNLVFKNNFVKLGLDTRYHIEVNMRNSNYNNAHFDYNQYDIPSLSSGVPGGWIAWRGSNYGSQDAHSEVLQNPTNDIKLFNFVNAPSLDSAGYRLASSSSGIDEGTAISGFTDDYAGTTRPQGNAWDVGAYEFVTSNSSVPDVPVGNYSSADTNKDGCVDIGEFSYYIGLRRSGVVLFDDVYSVLGLWLRGCDFVSSGSVANFVEAESGVVVSPMVVASSGGYVYTSVSNAGSVAFTFDVSSAGNYVLEAKVNAQDFNTNSFYVSVDGVEDVYDLTPSSGFVWDFVSWRGSGSDGTYNEFDPKVFSLSKGLHTVVFRGRETNTLLDAVRLSSYNGSVVVPVPVCSPGSTESCVTGKSGVCSAGTKTCSNNVWGVCVQNVNSSNEICSDNLDNDCDNFIDCSDSNCASNSVCQTSLGSGTTYYVSSSTGNDANSGTSTSAPWKSLSKVVSKMSTFKPGDNILFKRGDVWIAQRLYSTTHPSGTAGNYITYGSYGSGALPKLSSREQVSLSWTSEGNNIYSTSKTNSGRIFKDGVELLAAATTGIASGIGMGELGKYGVSYWWDKSAGKLYIHSTTNPSNSVWEMDKYSVVMWFPDADYIRFQDVEIVGGSSASVIMTGNSHWIFRNCKIGARAGYGIDIRSGPTNNDYNLIDNCLFDAEFTVDYSLLPSTANDYRGCSDGVNMWGSSNYNEVKNSVFIDWGHTAMQIAGKPDSPSRYNKLHDNEVYLTKILYGRAFTTQDYAENNEIYNNYMHDTYTQNQMMGHNNHVYNNVISNLYGTPIKSGGKLGHGISIENYGDKDYGITGNIIENNTFVNIAGTGIQIYTAYGSTANIHDNIIRNNILYNCGVKEKSGVALAIDVNTGTGNVNNVVSNNLIYNPGITNTCKSPYGSSAMSVSAFNVLSSYFSNNIASNPLFVDVNNANYNLQSGSPALIAGIGAREAVLNK
jgi:hypothetical protein